MTTGATTHTTLETVEFLYWKLKLITDIAGQSKFEDYESHKGKTNKRLSKDFD